MEEPWGHKTDNAVSVKTLYDFGANSDDTGTNRKLPLISA